MIQFDIPEEDMKVLAHERWYHDDPRVRRRMMTVYLKGKDYPHQEIGAIVGVTQKTVRSHLRLYEEGGLTALEEIKQYKPESALEPYREMVEEEFRERPPVDGVEAAKRIKELTGVQRSPDQVRRFLKSLGMKRRKVAQIPAKADPEEQEDFLKKSWSHG